MFDLMDRHYSGFRRSTFEADLDKKQWVIQVFDRVNGRLCGFSTQTILDAAVGNRPIRALFSGDTIIDRSAWGDPALSHLWGRLALALIDDRTDAEWYWFLISQGFRTYRFLPVFFHEFYPTCERPTPAWAAEVIDALGRHKFGDAYRPEVGLIRADANQYRVRPHVAGLAPDRLRDPHIRFFLERNPRHDRGDELCCITPLTRSNFRPAAWRVIGPATAPVKVP